MNKAILMLSKFYNWFNAKFWWIFTNGRKVVERSKIYTQMDADAKLVSENASNKITSTEHFIC